MARILWLKRPIGAPYPLLLSLCFLSPSSPAKPMTSIYGHELRWDKKTIVWSLEYSAQRQQEVGIEKSELLKSIQTAINTWLETSCLPFQIAPAEKSNAADITISFLSSEEWHHTKKMVAYTHVISEGEAAREGVIQAVKMEFNGTMPFTIASMHPGLIIAIKSDSSCILVGCVWAAMLLPSCDSS